MRYRFLKLLKNQGIVSICQALKYHKLIEFTLTVLKLREALPSAECRFQWKAKWEGLEGTGMYKKSFSLNEGVIVFPLGKNIKSQ